MSKKPKSGPLSSFLVSTANIKEQRVLDILRDGFESKRFEIDIMDI